MSNTDSKEDPRKKCLRELTHYVQWARKDDSIFLNIEPLKTPSVHTTKDNKKWLLLATLSRSSDDDTVKLLKHLSENISYDGKETKFHTCYLPGDIFVYIELPNSTNESTIIDIASDTEEAISRKSMEYDAKAFIRVARENIEAWEKSLERGKQGKPCNFKSVSKKIEELRKEIIDDEDGVLGNKHILFIDTTRCLGLININLYNLIDVIQSFMVKQCSSGLAREEAIRKVRKKLEDYEDELDSVRADKKDYRMSFLLDEFDDLIDVIKDLISPDKISKSKNIVRILEGFSTILENLGLQVDLTDDPEEKKLIMRQFMYGKELISKFLSATKSTVGNIYGSIVTKVMTE